MISSLTNERVKKIMKLYTSKGRKEAKSFVVEGPHLVKEAKEANLLIEAYTTSDKYEGELVSFDVMKKICKTDTPTPQIGICKLIEKKEIGNLVLLLDEIQDPGNLGTLMRSACAFGFETIFLADKTVDIYNDKAIRSSQGAIFKLNFIYGDKIDFIDKMKKTHHIYSTNVVNGINVSDVKEEKRYVLILGNEGNGVSKEINELNLDSLYIPITQTESLNVSVAGSILMYELKNKAN